MITILRPTRRTALLTAEVFDGLFARHIGSAFAMREVPLAAWCDEVLGPYDAPYPVTEAARRLAAATAGVDFWCPGCEAIGMAPWIVLLRNLAQAPVRLLLIAHAPGAYILEWALLRSLLAPGDVIVAPSESAKATIAFLCPSIEPFVRVIPHPMAPLGDVADTPRPGRRPRLVSLSRLTPTKLLHRAIAALAVMRDRHVRPLPFLHLAGSLAREASEEQHRYARSLGEMVKRLGLGDAVRFLEPIRGDEAKARFLARSDALVNLSVSVEESFGKAPVEALGCGVPVVATDWDGLPETIGAAGVRVAVGKADGYAPCADVRAGAVADGIACLLANPPSPEMCRAQAALFHPDRIIPRYRAALVAALDERDAAPDRAGAVPKGIARAAPSTGLLSYIAPLTDFSWSELFAHYRKQCACDRAAWVGRAYRPDAVADRFRLLLLTATRAPVEEFLGRGCRPVAEAPVLPNSRLACLAEAAIAGQPDVVRHGLAELERDKVGGVGVMFLRIEVMNATGDTAGAMRLAIDELATKPPGESEAFRVRQIAQMTRALGAPERALPWIREWLLRFPDSPDSGAVWLDRCVNAGQAGPGYRSESSWALARARVLLGDLPVVRTVSRSIAAGIASSAAQVRAG